MRAEPRRAARRWPVAWLLLACVTIGRIDAGKAGEAPPRTDREVVAQARSALGEIRSFERLAEAIVQRCHEPVTGAYQDWREEFRAELERARSIDKAFRRRASGAAADAPNDELLQPFVEAEGQVLYSRCLRWSTLLIQSESPLRARLAAQFARLRDDEARLRLILGDDARWREAQSGGAVP